MSELHTTENRFGIYLRDRRTKLDPVALGFPPDRRRTLGLRREEVAQRANISPTWYTWLEQGRGGAPSADVLDRISRALMLTNVERALRAAGAELSDVVSATVYLANADDWGKFNAVYRELMPQPYPTRTALGAELRGILVEISVIAYVGGN